ncbi:uncharacterized protein LOC116265319 [Nymphaea colorata]|uniref:uncharacterized protein LOC116265319 n=1 Tax=Nymphaea colorata TaxID=210225 RepID=UPI00214F5F05|nr:uncharacterized protein LOC116265319 [Nymphaea colorata]
MCSTPCIFMMYEDSRAYKPWKTLFINIGPYHYRIDHTLEETVLHLVVQRAQMGSIEDVVNAVRDDALEVRKCYEGANSALYKFPNNDEFVMTLVRDGCFVLELMHIMTTEPHPFRTIVTRFSPTLFPLNNTMIRHILLDVLVVKNQIPMAFLQRLYSHLQYGDPQFETMLNKFLDFYFMQTLDELNLAGACHLLDAARKKFLPKMVGQRNEAGSASTARFSPCNFGEMSVRYSAIDLKDSGVTISPAAEGMVMWDPRQAWTPLLKLPRVLINRDSDFILRNMVAYEQRLVEDDNHPVQPVSSYLRLLSDLVLTAADVRVLTVKGIIDNQLGSLDDIVNFFKHLELGDTYGIDMLSKTRKDINEHCEREGISKWADLTRTFFRSPWSYCSFAAALILLILTLLQVLAYKPKMPLFLGVGPYYASNAHTLEDTVLNLVLERTQISSPKDVVNALRNDALEVRECYEGANSPFYKLPDNDEFVKLLVRGGCFVLELMHIMTTTAHPLRTISTRFSSSLFPLNNTMQRHILLDVLMVKNQFPMAFLRRLYSHLQYRDPPFEIMLNKFLDFHLTQTFEVPNLAGTCHLLDAARMKFLPMMVGQSSVAGSATGACFSPGNFGEMSVRYSAIDLEDSGVTISPAAEGMVIWDPRPAWRPFLKLPRILINRDSDYIFRNMVAYEQRLAEDDNHPVQPVSSYLRLLSDLVLTAADARVLTFRGIIDNQLGSLEVVVHFFKDLELGDTYGIDMLSKVRKDINTHCERKGISKWADLRRTYFRSPWSYCSLAAALILLILTLLQVLYAMLAYHLPK